MIVLPTPRCALAVAVVAVVVAVSGTTSMHVLWLAAAAVLLAIAGADLMLGPRSACIRISRDVPARLGQTMPAKIRYRIENASGTRVDLRLVESRDYRIEMKPDELVARIEPMGRCDVEAVWTGAIRGSIRLERIDIAVRNSLGLFERRYRMTLPATIDVVPRSASLHRATLATRNRALAAGLRRIRRPGVGTEFERLRAYAPGDPFNKVHWKSTARRAALTVLEEQVERNQQIIVALDCGRLMLGRTDVRSKLDYALEGALALARTALVAGDRLGMYAFADKELAWVVPRSGNGHFAKILDASYAFQPVLRESDYERAVTTLQRRISKRSLIVLFSDIFDPELSGETLGAFRVLARSNLVLVVLMNDAVLETAVEREPRDRRAALEAGLAMGLLDERRYAVARLRAQGLMVVDVAPTSLAATTVDEYLTIKSGGRL